MDRQSKIARIGVVGSWEAGSAIARTASGTNAKGHDLQICWR